MEQVKGKTNSIHCRVDSLGSRQGVIDRSAIDFTLPVLCPTGGAGSAREVGKTPGAFHKAASDHAPQTSFGTRHRPPSVQCRRMPLRGNRWLLTCPRSSPPCLSDLWDHSRGRPPGPQAEPCLSPPPVAAHHHRNIGTTSKDKWTMNSDVPSQCQWNRAHRATHSRSVTTKNRSPRAHRARFRSSAFLPASLMTYRVVPSGRHARRDGPLRRRWSLGVRHHGHPRCRNSRATGGGRRRARRAQQRRRRDHKRHGAGGKGG